LEIRQTLGRNWPVKHMMIRRLPMGEGPQMILPLN